MKQYWEGKWNDRRPETLNELQAPEIVHHGTSGEMNGIDEYKQAYNGYLSAIGDSHVEIKKLIAEGDLVVSYVEISGVNTGELDGLPPTGKQVQVALLTIFRLENRKIAEEWEIMDDLGLMMQLGLELKMKN